MDQARSRQYLAALEIPIWRARSAAAAGLAGDDPRADVRPAPPDVSVTAVLPAADQTPVVPATPPTPVAPAGPAPMPLPMPPDAMAPPAWLDDVPPDEEPPPWLDADDDDQLPAPAPPPGNPVATMDWPRLEQAVAGCRACRLCEGRNKTVFGVGNRQAALMLIGEGPGQDEDRTGEPFVGRAGQLLNRMLAAIGLGREQVFIANVVKCRPPNNRNPQPDEVAACRAFLARQIELVAPRLLVSLGGVSATALLGQQEPVGKLRGRLHSYQGAPGQAPIPLMVTYHPSYYLRSPAEKARGWEDMQRIVRELAGGPTARG